MTDVLHPPEPTAPGLRERKKQATRRRIKTAALALALEQGPDGLTVEAIAEAAEVSPRTFFNYFDCKEEALIGDGAQVAGQLRDLVAARPADEPPLRILRAAVLDSDLLSAEHLDRDRVLARQRLVRDHPSLLPRQLAQYAVIERALIDALAQRLHDDPDRELRPALLSAIAVTVIRVAMQRWTADASRPLTELVDEQFGLLEENL
ncbi:MAG: TetR/AcrR family transcriptional regulator [Marmoricola sp.]